MRMKAILAASAALMFVAPAFAQPGAVPAAPAAPVAPYVSTCTPPSDSLMPPIPNGATAKAVEINKANKAMTVWQNAVTAYGKCKQTEMENIQAELNAAQAASPKAAVIKSFNDQMANLNKGVEAFKASGVKMPGLVGEPKKPPRCGDAPPLDPAPPAPVAGAKSGEIRKATEAYVKWASPRYIYVTCMQPEAEAAVASQGADTAGPLAKGQAARAEYDAFTVKANKVNADWKVFSDAYAARLKKAAGN